MPCEQDHVAIVHWEAGSNRRIRAFGAHRLSNGRFHCRSSYYEAHSKPIAPKSYHLYTYSIALYVSQTTR